MALPVHLTPCGWRRLEFFPKLLPPVFVERIELHDRRRAKVAQRQLEALLFCLSVILTDGHALRGEFRFRRQPLISGAAKPGPVDNCRATGGRRFSLFANSPKMVERMAGPANAQLAG